MKAGGVGGGEAREATARATVQLNEPRLAVRGHDEVNAELDEQLIRVGGGQMIRIEPSGFLVGGSDARKDGMALGY